MSSKTYSELYEIVCMTDTYNTNQPQRIVHFNNMFHEKRTKKQTWKGFKIDNKVNFLHVMCFWIKENVKNISRGNFFFQTRCALTRWPEWTQYTNFLSFETKCVHASYNIQTCTDSCSRWKIHVLRLFGECVYVFIYTHYVCTIPVSHNTSASLYYISFLSGYGPS